MQLRHSPVFDGGGDDEEVVSSSIKSCSFYCFSFFLFLHFFFVSLLLLLRWVSHYFCCYFIFAAMLQVLPSKKKKGKKGEATPQPSSLVCFSVLFFLFLIGITLPSYSNTNNKNVCWRQRSQRKRWVLLRVAFYRSGPGTNKSCRFLPPPFFFLLSDNGQ